MRLANYADKIFNFLAENLRRLAEVLSAKQSAQKSVSADEGESAPHQDWLERTRAIPPENWFGISVEDEIKPPIQAAKPLSAVKTVEEIFVARRPKNQPPSEKPPARISENFPLAKPKSARNGSPFLTFKRSAEDKKKKTAAPRESISKVRRQTSEESGERNAASEPKFRLTPAQSIFERDRKAFERPAPSVEISAEKQPRPDAESSVFKREDFFVDRQKSSIEREKSSAIKSADVARSKSESEIVKEKKVVAENAAARREPSNLFSPETLSPKIKSEPAEIGFKFLSRKMPGDAIIAAKTERIPETSNFPSRGRDNADKFQEADESGREKKREKKTDGRAAAFVAAEAPWADLPDEAHSAREIENDFTENEHLRFLEYEQAGRT